MNYLFTDAVNYRQCRLIKKLSRHEDDMAHKLSHSTKKAAVQMKDRTFGGRDPVTVIAFLQEFKYHS